MASAIANIPSSTVDGSGFLFSGVINFSGDSVMSTNTADIAPNVVVGNVEGIFMASANGTIQLQAATEIGASNIIIKAGSFVEVVEIP